VSFIHRGHRQVVYKGGPKREVRGGYEDDNEDENDDEDEGEGDT
jgi:hypothetical protein